MKNILEDQLDVALKLLSASTKVTYSCPESIPRPLESEEVMLELHKLTSCPDPDRLIAAISKKRGRVTAMKQQKYSLALCIMLLASRGYCITSAELEGVEDAVVETCWESLQNIYVSVGEPLKSWLNATIGGRGYVAYGKQFCQRKTVRSGLEGLGTRLSGGSDFKLLDKEDKMVPDTMWSRNDTVYTALYSHFRHEARDISDNT